MDAAIAIAILAVFVIIFGIVFEIALRIWERTLTGGDQ